MSTEILVPERDFSSLSVKVGCAALTEDLHQALDFCGIHRLYRIIEHEAAE